MKSNADRAARVLNADANRGKVISLVRNAIDSRKAAANRGSQPPPA